MCRNHTLKTWVKASTTQNVTHQVDEWSLITEMIKNLKQRLKEMDTHLFLLWVPSLKSSWPRPRFNPEDPCLVSKVPQTWSKTQVTSRRATEASPPSAMVPRALIHQERATMTVWIPGVPPFINPPHFSSSGVSFESVPSTMLRCQEGWIAVHHFVNDFWILPAERSGPHPSYRLRSLSRASFPLGEAPLGDSRGRIRREILVTVKEDLHQGEASDSQTSIAPTLNSPPKINQHLAKPKRGWGLLRGSG